MGWYLLLWVGICYSSIYGERVFVRKGMQIFATAANKHSEYLLRLQLRYYPDIYLIAFFYGIRAKCTLMQQ